MEQYNVINNMDEVLEFYNNIGNKKQFNVLYTMYLNLLESHKLKNYHSNIIYDTELYSTLTMSLIACLKTFSYTNNKKILVRIIKYHETHSVFDEPERANLEFDFTRSD